MTDKEQTIPDDEDLSYEMTVNNKRYDAGFYQISPLDTIAIYNESKQSSAGQIYARTAGQSRQKKYQLQSNLIISIIN